MLTGRDFSAPRYSISDLVYKDGDSVEYGKPQYIPSGNAGQQSESFPTDAIRKDNLAQNLLAPMDMV